MIALIDGDIVAYRCAASCEPTKAKPERETVDDAKHRAENLLQDIVHDTEATSYKVFLGGGKNFRKEIWPEYKAHRTKPNPAYLPDVQQFLVEYWDATFTDGIEADDALGIASSTEEESSVIVSIDKDLLQLPGLHYNFVTKNWTPVDSDTGDFNFWRQMVLGDRADNVFGFDGKARNDVPQMLLGAINELRDMSFAEDRFRYVLDMYDSEERFVTNFKLLWILRTPEIEWPFLQQQLEMVRKLESTH